MFDLEERRNNCLSSTRLCFPEIFYDENRFNQADLYSLRETGPSFLLEFSFLDNLSNEIYWCAFNDLTLMSERNFNNFSESEMKFLSKLMVNQAFVGKRGASVVPLYSDVLNLFVGEDSPIKDFVTLEDKVNAVNDGFWHCLRK